MEEVTKHDTTNTYTDPVLTVEEEKLLKRATYVQRRLSSYPSLTYHSRKTDWRLIPILGACYAISAIDRINVCLSSHTHPPRRPAY